MKPPPPPHGWRLVGKSGDGLLVTLGKYQTREEAEKEMGDHIRKGYYRDIAVRSIDPPKAKVAD